MNGVRENAHGMNRVAKHKRFEVRELEYTWKDTRDVEFA
jgi:hypothetical protein